MSILQPGPPLRLLLPLQASAPPSLCPAGPSPLPQEKGKGHAAVVGHHQEGGQARERGWQQDVHRSMLSPAKELARFGAPTYFACFTLSDLQEQLPFFEGESVQHVRELLSDGDALLFLILSLSLMQNNVHSG